MNRFQIVKSGLTATSAGALDSCCPPAFPLISMAVAGLTQGVRKLRSHRQPGCFEPIWAGLAADVLKITRSKTSCKKRVHCNQPNPEASKEPWLLLPFWKFELWTSNLVKCMRAMLDADPAASFPVLSMQVAKWTKILFSHGNIKKNHHLRPQACIAHKHTRNMTAF